MGHPKMNGSAPSLDVRISSALASDVVDRAALVSLLAEAHDALGMVQNVIVAETPRLHDLSNEDPNASLDLINRCKLRVERLEIAIPKLHGRIKAIEAFEYRQRYHTRADALRAARDELAEELAESYLGFLEQITNLYARIDKNSAAIDQLHASAPAGEPRRLLAAELVARGIDRYDAQHPRLRDNLKLPEFIKSSTVAFPPDPMAQWNAHAAQAHAAMAQRMAEKGALATGDHWHAGRDLAAQQGSREPQEGRGNQSTTGRR